MAQLGNTLKRLRQREGLTQGQVAAYARVDRSYVSQIENGHVTSVGATILLNLARLLNTSTDYLLGLTANPWPPDNTTEPTTELEWKLLEEFRKLTEAEQPIALEQVRLIIRLREANRAYIIGGEAEEGDEDENKGDRPV